MTTQEITQKLRTLIEPYVQDQDAFENINENTDLLNDLKINSANLVDIIIDVEDAFDIEIDDEAAEKMLTVKAAVEIIQERIA
ncbi:MAG: phosphopantetheine-binding protein [Bacteroidota bacterium]